jgi:hypothetical protein
MPLDVLVTACRISGRPLETKSQRLIGTFIDAKGIFVPRPRYMKVEGEEENDNDMHANRSLHQYTPTTKSKKNVANAVVGQPKKTVGPGV